MNATLRKVLLISAKNAVNAILVTSPTTFIAPKDFHFHSLKGVEHLLEMMCAAVLSREFTIWLPKLLAWSQSPTNGDGPGGPTKVVAMVLCVLLLFNVSCTTDQVLADLNVAIQIATQIAGALAPISPTDAVLMQRASAIASNALGVIQTDYKAYKASGAQTDLAKLEAVLDVFKGNLNAEIAAVGIKNSTSAAKVNDWANLIYSVTDAILAALPHNGTRTMTMPSTLPTPANLKLRWSVSVCNGEAHCAALVH